MQALAASTIVVVPVDFNTEPTVLTVRVPTRNLKPGWKEFEWTNVRTWRISPRSWLVRPSGHLAIDILLPTADADRQIQVRLADGVSFEPHARKPGSPSSPLPRLDIAVMTPPPLLEMAASVKAILEDWIAEAAMLPRPPSLTRSLIDLAQARIAAASHTLEHYKLPPGPWAAPGPWVAPPPDDPKPGDREKIHKIQKEIKILYDDLPAVTTDETMLVSLRRSWKQDPLGKLALYRHASVDQFDPRTLVARVDVIEDVAQRATPENAVIYADVHVDDRGYLADARASALMSLLLIAGVLAFLLLAFCKRRSWAAP